MAVFSSRSYVVKTLLIIVNARFDIGSIPKASPDSCSVEILDLISTALGRCSGCGWVIWVSRSPKFRSHTFRLFNLGAMSSMVTPIAYTSIICPCFNTIGFLQFLNLFNSGQTKWGVPLQ